MSQKANGETTPYQSSSECVSPPTSPRANAVSREVFSLNCEGFFTREKYVKKNFSTTVEILRLSVKDFSTRFARSKNGVWRHEWFFILEWKISRLRSKLTSSDFSTRRFLHSLTLGRKWEWRCTNVILIRRAIQRSPVQKRTECHPSPVLERTEWVERSFPFTARVS